MNNKPVAWILENNDEYINITFSYSEMREWEDFLGDNEQIIPLYTHPVKEEDEQNWKEMYWQMHELNHKHWSELKAHPVKELTDEEIEECYWGDGYPDNPRHPKEFAYAILRKAQDK